MKKIVSLIEIIVAVAFLIFVVLSTGTVAEVSGALPVTLVYVMVQIPVLGGIFTVLWALHLLLGFVSLCSSKKKRESIIHVIVPTLLVLYMYWYLVLSGCWESYTMSGAIHASMFAMIVVSITKQFLRGKKEK